MGQAGERISLRLTTIGAIFTLLVPVPVIGVISWFIAHWTLQPAFFGLEPLRYLGAALIVIGAALIVIGFTVYCLGLGPLEQAPVRFHRSRPSSAKASTNGRCQLRRGRRREPHQASSSDLSTAEPARVFSSYKFCQRGAATG